MSSLPRILVDFAGACDGRFGAGSAGYNDDGAFVAVEGRTVHVNLDQNANRVVLWTEIERPQNSPIGSFEHAAVGYTAREFLARGLAIGVNRKADLILLGRSIEQDALAGDDALDLVEEIAREAEAVGAMLQKAARPVGAAAPAGDAVIFRS